LENLTAGAGNIINNDLQYTTQPACG